MLYFLLYLSFEGATTEIIFIPVSIVAVPSSITYLRTGQDRFI